MASGPWCINFQRNTTKKCPSTDVFRFALLYGLFGFLFWIHKIDFDENHDEITSENTDGNSVNAETKDWLKVHCTPWEVIENKWTDTWGIRRKDLQNTKTNDLLLTEWPLYKNSTGFRLIEIDFQKLFPENHGKLLQFWESFKIKTTTLFNKNLKDESAQGIFKNYSENKECVIAPSSNFHQTTLLFNTFNDIFITNTTGRPGNPTFERIGKNLMRSSALDYYYDKKMICWSDEGLESIQCKNLNQSSSNYTVINSGLDKPDGLAIDWYTNKIYWTDGELTRIEVTTFDGQIQKVLFWSDLDQPRALALIPTRKIMLWTDWGENPKIERASMDGDPESRKVLVNDDIHWPNGLAIDADRDLIYWVDGKLLFIEVMTLDGEDRRKIVRNLEYPQSLVYVNNRLFWTDWKINSIGSFDLLLNEKLPPIKTPDVPIVVRAWDSNLQKFIKNPCMENNGNCSHLCLLSSTNPKGFSCACKTGVKLISPTKCADGPHEMLFLVQRTQISRISLDSLDFTSFALSLGKIGYGIAIDYDPVDNYILWTDADLHAIRKAKISGNEKSVVDVISSEIEFPDGLAIDWLARNMYWTDPTKDRIEVCRLDGSSRKVIIHDNLEEPRAIALDPTLGWMFWSDWDENEPKIERASLDGSERVVLIQEDLGWPNGIALDLDLKKMYWCDAKTDRIEVINMDGSDRRVILSDQLAHVFGLSVLGDYIYWTDWQRRSVDRVNRITGADRITVVDQFPDIMGLKVAKLREVKGDSPCALNNGGCSNLCLNRPTNYVCQCPIDQELKIDKKTCKTPAAFLIFSRKTMFGTKVIGRISIEFNEDNLNHNVIPFKDVEDSHGLDMHVADERIYWTNPKSKCIMRAYINGSDVQKVVDSGLVRPEGIAVDWLAHNIFWADSGTQRIEVSRLDGSSRRILLWKGIAEPKHIVLEPRKGYMYWTELASDSIRRAAMDGSDVKTIVKDANHATGLSLDPETRRLYWACEVKPSQIVSSDWEGKNKTVLVSLSEEHFQNVVTLYQDYLYWSDYTTGDIERVHKLTGQNRSIVHSKLDYMDSLLTFHTSRQPGSNQCRTNNGGCKHLCLALPGNRMTCACQTHYRLAPDNVSCIPPKNFFIFSQKTSFGRLMPNSSDSPDAPLSMAENTKNIKAIDYDSVTQYIYGIEGKSHSIKRYNLTNSMVFVNNGPAPYDLAVDPIGRLLFWSCSQSNTINVTHLDSNELNIDTIDIGETENPRNLAIHPMKRLLFWTDTGTQQAIYRAMLDGSDRTVLLQDLESVTAITVDTHRDLIFFAIENTGIDFMNLHGKNRQNLVSKHINQISAIASLDGYIYWVDEKGKTERVTIDGNNRRPDLNRYQITDIVAVSIIDQKTLRNHTCYSGRSKCSHICIASPENKGRDICSCPQGLRLLDDKKNCGALPICGPDHFTCAATSPSGNSGPNKDCIPVSWWCDGQFDCPDNSDETGCPLCGKNQFKCQTGDCIDKSLVCDGTTHCLDGHDEADCCKSPQDFQCPGSKLCILNSFLCDGWEHCADGADESSELCNQISNGRIVSTSDKKTFIIVIVVFMLIMFLVAYVIQICKTKLTRNQDEPKDDQAGIPLSPGSVAPTNNNKNPRITKLVSVADAVRMSNLSGRNSMNSYDRNHITGASSSTTNGSSLIGYPLNPPPSPATTAASTRGNSYRPYRHYKIINQPPPPTPCSTDICDESDSIYTTKSHRSIGDGVPNVSAIGVNPSHSLKKYRYETEPYPPPPTPRSHYHSDMPESCPPSPSSRSSTYFAPLPPPPSPDHYSPSKGYS